MIINALCKVSVQVSPVQLMCKHWVRFKGALYYHQGGTILPRGHYITAREYQGVFHLLKISWGSQFEWTLNQAAAPFSEQQYSCSSLEKSGVTEWWQGVKKLYAYRSKPDSNGLKLNTQNTATYTTVSREFMGACHQEVIGHPFKVFLHLSTKEHPCLRLTLAHCWLKSAHAVSVRAEVCCYVR